MDAKSIATLVALLKAGLTENQRVLCGMEEGLPEPWKGEIRAMREQFDQVLAKMPDTEKVGAAQEANWGITELCFAVNRLLSTQTGLATALKKLQGERAAEMAGLDGKIGAAIETRVAAGDFIPKAVLQTKIDEAVTAATGALAARHQTIETRRAELVKAGLPLPGDESLLVAEEKTFTAAKTEAASRSSILKTKGISDKAHPETLSGLVWAGKEQFEREIKLIDLALATKPGAGNLDPTLGGGGAGGVTTLCV
jgi:hypothetical protein